MAVVLDTGPLIKNIELRKLGEIFYTTPQVLSEVRDKIARSHLSSKLEEIKVSEASEEDIESVITFSKKTGDFSSLSQTDIQVLALAVRLHKESGGTISESPGQIKPYSNRAKLDEWITPDNFKSASDKVSLVTFDFAIQNVAMQMGVKITNPSGIEIRFLKKWVKKCTACNEICDDPEKEFCPECGNHSLVKVSYTVDDQGNKQFYEVRNKKVDLTGTIYPIPLPKGGKNSNDIILREDQLLLMGGRQNKWNWKKPEVYDKESVEFFGHSIKANSGFKYGPACKNPNQKHKKTKKKI